MPIRVATREESAGVFIIRPEGELVINNHGVFENDVKAVLSKKPSVLIFDLTDVEYISSMGIRTLLVAHKNMLKFQGRVFLANLQPQVKKVLDIVNAFPEERIFSTGDDMRRFLETVQK